MTAISTIRSIFAIDTIHTIGALCAIGAIGAIYAICAIVAPHLYVFIYPRFLNFKCVILQTHPLKPYEILNFISIGILENDMHVTLLGVEVDVVAYHHIPLEKALACRGWDVRRFSLGYPRY